jgi:hypothetical protein
MTDLLTATQDAFFAILTAGMGADHGEILQHVPENTQPPLTVLGSIEALDIDGKDSGLEQHTVDVHYLFRGPARRKLYAMMQAGRDAIEAGSLRADGALFGPARWRSSETDIADDGVTYVGTQTFEVIVQAA